MDYTFKSNRLKLLHDEERDAHKYPRGVVDAFFEVIQIIRNAPDERDFYAFNSLKFEKLSGDRQGQYSLRLNKQFRLIITFEETTEGKIVVIHEIIDYH